MLGSISLPYSVVRFEAHERLKQDLLRAIDETESASIKLADYQITNTDWNTECSQTRPYVDVISVELAKTLKAAFIEMGFDQYQVHNVWFQQYTNKSCHPWHNHGGCHFTCIYYVELPDDSLLTQFLDPIDQKSVFQIDAKEGDILIIPSLLKHQAPEVTSDVRKTIISFNASVICEVRYE